MEELIFATANEGKAKEVKDLLSGLYKILTLNDLGLKEEIPETGSTLDENAIQKARFVFERYGIPCFSDDSGLEVKALNEAPGVYSARYGGPEKSPEQNIQRLLSELNGIKQREARFVTVIALILKNGEEFLFKGIVEGEIITEMKGEMGFGYDPVFRPSGSELTFAGMTPEEKNKISHRARAVKKLVDFLKSETKLQG